MRVTLIRLEQALCSPRGRVRDRRRVLRKRPSWGVTASALPSGRSEDRFREIKPDRFDVAKFHPEGLERVPAFTEK